MDKVKDIIKRIYGNKAIMRLLWVAVLILFIFTFIQYKKYKPSKLHYNIGVKKFEDGNYEMADIYFKDALYYPHSKRLECRIRINRALALVTPITPESVTKENIDECIATLEEARDYLIENDCAHKDDSNGHNRKAQKLKEEIDNYIEQLKEQKEKQEEEDKKNSQEEKTEEEKKKEEEEQKKQEEEERKKNEEQKKLEEQFDQIQQEGLKERNEKLQEYHTFETDDVYYSGKSW